MKAHVSLLTLLTISIAFSALSIPPVRASGADPGVVLISPPIQGPFAAGTTVTYQVMVSGIDPFNGWDILVQVALGSLLPESISITSNLITANFGVSMTELVNCVNAGAGIPLNHPGDLFCGANDGAGIAHSSAIATGPPPMTTATSGLLFTIAFKAEAGDLSGVHLFNDLVLNGGSSITHASQDGIYGQQSQFVHGKLSWTHHLSLTKNSNAQHFTATVRDEAPGIQFVQVMVTGNNGLTAISPAQQLTPGTVTKIPFVAPVSAPAGVKICFTAKLIFGESLTSVSLTSTVTKSGCFAVVS